MGISRHATVYSKLLKNFCCGLNLEKICGSIKQIRCLMLSFLHYRKGDVTGTSLNGKESGVEITQRKAGSYQGSFTNRFGKKRQCMAKRG